MSGPEQAEQTVSGANGHVQAASDLADAARTCNKVTDEEFDELKDDEPTLVRKGLYIGSIDAAENVIGLKGHNITHILQVAQLDVELRHPGIEYMVLRVRDENEVDLVAHFESCFEFIDRGRAAGAVLVHCVAGVSRSATVCLGYLMSHEQLRYPEAFTVLQKARPWINPNEGFQAQLREFERLGADPTRWSRPWPELWGCRQTKRSVYVGV